ncbi:PREDICTED: putative sodium-coupled neutral amino acid transporter 11 [Nanorana parkeri]|uniref:putative sodium-coupled neutral amino acid transporter 11 n=1 Tax=Nanorana parkeri TaxID=125878 RepID=UPI00085502D8|nr:PREDICTED: putative sodium-coupled neutral amino acid transporter 11 [Nanorana parkeri]
MRTNSAQDGWTEQIDINDTELLVEEDKKDNKLTRNVFWAGFNMINAILGTGMIGLPYSMKLAGLPMGNLSRSFYTYAIDYSMILLIKSGEMSGTSTYQSLVSRTFGFPGYMAVSALQFLYPFAAMVSYNIITGDILPKILQRIPGVSPESVLADRRLAILGTTAVVTLPIALYRNMQRLGKVSLISFLLTVVVLLIIIIRASSMTVVIPYTEDAWAFANWNVVQAVGVMSFVFMCHHACFLIHGSLENATISSWSRITHVSMIMSLIISLQYAIFGYITFTGFTQGDLFENYCKDDNLVTAGRLCYAITIILTYPMECFVAREVISNVFFGGNLSTVLHFTVTLLVVSLTTVISLLSDCLGMVLELNGVLSATPLVFIIPTACYLKLSADHWYHPSNFVPCVILLLGIIIMPVGFIMAIFYPQECSHGNEMFYCLTNSTPLDTSSSFPYPINASKIKL